MTLPRAAISYAENAEDVVLARLFAGAPSGRYIDVGAGDPVAASVTKHFYDHGWRGINIEPIPAIAERLRVARPGDVNIACAVGAQPGKTTLHVVDDEWGWSTLDDDLARGYRDVNGWPMHDVEVEVATLAEVFVEHGGEIDFLKIDVEGAEADVIAGADFSRHRPRVIVVEATRPGSPEPSHHSWEHMLLEAGYQCALFDGLNRFYALTSDDTALRVLGAPANVFDSFETYLSKQERDERIAVSNYARRLENALHEANAARQQAAESLDRLQRVGSDAERPSTEPERHAAERDTNGDERGLAEHESPRDFVDRVNASGGGYHRLAFPDGLVVTGVYDMAKYLPHFRIPKSLNGMRVLDVGTASGFFAIECERRGASVTAIDVENDRLLPEVIKVFGLPIDYAVKDAYRLDASFGQFDLVICGTLLLHLPDPVGVLRAIRSVTRDRLVISTTATPTSTADPLPSCLFLGDRAHDGDYWNYWEFSAAALTRMLLAAGFSRVADVEHFDIEPESGFEGAAAPQVVLSAYV